jgi:hypothetical protein
MSLAGSDYLTTGQVAKLVGVAMGTASGWVDSGKLPGFRLPTGRGANFHRGDRRVARSDLIAFLEGIRHPASDRVRGCRLVLACGLTPAVPEGWEAETAECPAAAGSAFARLCPAAVVIDVGAWGPAVALPLAAWLLGRESPPRVLLVSTEDVSPAELVSRVPGAAAAAGPLMDKALAVWLEGR